MMFEILVKRSAGIGVFIICAVFAVASYGQRDAPAAAELRDQDGGAIGTVTLEETVHGVLVHAGLQGLGEGPHAFHVHAVGSCAAPFESAAGHFNPEDRSHGFRSQDGPHAGDMPNIHVPASGILEIEVFNPWLTLGPALFDDDGAAIVIHQGGDDYATDPAGSAGPRVACGVIERRN